ncbi:MAG: very short patch repair endonuclease [Thermodesulfobacteriota bacterium]
MPASAKASRVKRRNRARDTSPELRLRRLLWADGMRYRLHASDLPGKPDIVFPRQRLAIFVDGDFWHGREWTTRRQRLAQGVNGAYWIAKIEYNMRRDGEQTALLESCGWRVLRFWESQILKTPGEILQRVGRELNGHGSRRMGPEQQTVLKPASRMADKRK